ncbi:ABC transporter permease [Novosphingobium sp. B 225]|uniref:ABC transporter permease n=1 Tax=Novosphingobium sp. B 225 TaxID=1961849 RepID=UPI000B4BF389|nr:ABC transporter permease [Novosphingobium sp. B 225]
MREWAEFREEHDADGAVTVVLSGPLVVSAIGELDRDLRALAGPVARVDLSEVSEIDTVGAWIAWRLARDHSADISSTSDKAERLIAAVHRSGGDAAVTPPELPVFERVFARVGDYVLATFAGMRGFLGFMGAMLIAIGHLLRNPGEFRIKALVRQLELVGVNALGIIGLMSFLVGIVIAQQGAVQLQQFGAEIYTINLTGRLAFRELGVLMTAIMVAGRSGSAFAAQLGTMKLTEEVDAMRTIGVSPVEALVIPRVLAATFMMVLLGFYASLAAILGGAFISTMTLEIPFMTFLTRIQEVVPLHDIWVGLIKAPVFGAIVAMAGCYQGMQVKGNSEEVGLRTTIAVVQAIFAVIVLDAFFAVFFTEVGWG